MHIHASGPGLVAAVFTGMWCLLRLRLRVRVKCPWACGALVVPGPKARSGLGQLA